MTGGDRARGIAAGIVAGGASGMFGVGGGLALVPALTGVFRLTQHQAHGTSLAVISITAVTALLVYGKHANVVWVAAAPMALGSLMTAGLGARLAARTPAGRLRQAFAALLLLVGLRLLWAPPAVAAAHGLGGTLGILLCLVLGLAAGVLAGYMGVGGGILVVPVLTVLFGMSQQAAQGTSLAAMLVTAPTAALEHSRHRNVVWRLVPTLAIGTAVGAPLAAWGAQGLPHTWLARGFGIFLIVTALNSWMRASRTPAAPGAGEEAR